MAASKLPDITYIREALDYDPDTGIFTWKVRPFHHFDATTYNPQTWNTRFAGKRAGSLCRSGPRRIYWMIELGLMGRHKAHRIAWLMVHGDPVPELIDHINADGADNRIANLRAATKAENGWNQRRFIKETTAPVKGVFRHARRYPNTPFVAYITVNKKRLHLGYFATLEEAAEARRKAAAQFHGDFRHDG